MLTEKERKTQITVYMLFISLIILSIFIFLSIYVPHRAKSKRAIKTQEEELTENLKETLAKKKLYDIQLAGMQHFNEVLASNGSKQLQTLEPQNFPYAKPGVLNLEKLGFPLSERTFTDKDGVKKTIGAYCNPPFNPCIVFTGIAKEGEEPEYVPKTSAKPKEVEVNDPDGSKKKVTEYPIILFDL